MHIYLPNKTLCIYGIINVSIGRAHDQYFNMQRLT
jgi:hypothetical protein